MRFSVKGYRVPEGLATLAVEAGGEAAARRDAEARGYRVLSVRPAGMRLHPPWPRRVGFSVPVFAQELLALLDAGLGVVEAVDILAAKAGRAETREVLAALHRRLSEGLAVSRALEAEEAFPALFVASVRASERSGGVPEALRRYLAYQRQLTGLRDKVVAAAIYPTLLVAVGLMVVAFLLAYVVPRFARIYEDLGPERLPLLSRALMEWGRWAAGHGVLLAFAGVGAIAALAFAATRPGLRAAVERRLWRIPGVGERLRVYQLARFTRTVALLLKGGIPLVPALGMTEDLLRQPALADGLRRARKAISEGGSVSEHFGAQGLATEVGTRLLVVGERSGELGETMERIAGFYDEETARSVEWFARLFEPALMIVIGLLIGGIVVLMYLPIFELASGIQ